MTRLIFILPVLPILVGIVGVTAGMVGLPILSDALAGSTAAAPTPADPSPYAVSLGSLGAEVLNWVVAIVAPIIASALVGLLVKGWTMLGLKIDDQRRQKLQDIVVNGINFASQKLSRPYHGRMTFELKNKLQVDVLEYVKAQGADTMKALGLDPEDPLVRQAIQARIERALNDPLSPTPVEMTPPEVLGVNKTRNDKSATGSTGVETGA